MNKTWLGLLLILISVSIIMFYLSGVFRLNILAGPGTGSITFTDDYNAHIVIETRDCIGNPRSTILVCGGGVSEETKNRIINWEIVDSAYCTVDGSAIGCGNFQFYDSALCIETGFIMDGVFCDWYANFDIRATDIPTVTTYTFGRFKPPVPFTASDSEKGDAPIEETTTVDLSYYPVGYEVVRVRVDWKGPSLSRDTPVTFKWYNKDTNSLIFTYSYTFRQGWDNGYAYSWIGHKDVGEIDRGGNYEVRIYAQDLFDHRIDFTVTQPIPTGALTLTYVGVVLAVISILAIIFILIPK